MPLPRCFFDIAINGVPSGRIIFELFKEDCPRTVENFRCLCTGERGEGRTTFKPLHYKGTPIHRIVRGFIIQGGDFSNGDGTGGESIYGGMFKDENFKHKHDKPFLLSMANKGPNTNGSQFFITTRPAPHLDGIHVVFGHVIDGIQFVTEIENQKVDINHRPYADIRITHSSELVLQKKGKMKKAHASVSTESESSDEDSSDEESSSKSESSSESESEVDSEEERRRRKKRRLKKRKLLKEVIRKKKRSKLKEERKLKRKKKRSQRKKKNKKHSKKESKSSDSDSDTENEPVTSTVPELAGEEIPPDIKSDRPSWLFRRSRTPSPRRREEEKRNKKVVSSRQPAPSYKPILVSRDNEVSQSGRKLKGRGTMRYRTPPRFGDGDDLRYELQSSRTRMHATRVWPPYYRQRRSRSRSRSQDRRDYRHSNRHESQRRFNELSPRRRRQRGFDEKQQDSLSDEKDLGGRNRGRREERNRERSRSPGSRMARHWDRSRRSLSGSDEDSHNLPARSDKRIHERKSVSNSPEPNKTTHYTEHRQESQRSHHHQRKSHSRSRSPTSIRHSKHSPAGHRRWNSSSQGDSAPVMSKWARHWDQENANNSTSEEDQELERAFQKEKKADDVEEDVFGLNNILT